MGEIPAVPAQCPGKRGLLSLAVFGALVFVYSIPGTVGLRNLLLLLGLACAFPGLRILSSCRPLRTPAMLWCALTVWLILQALLLSSYPAQALVNLSGDWLRGLLAALFSLSVLGLLVKDCGAARSVSICLSISVVALGLHPILYLAQQGWIGLHTGSFPFQYHDAWIGGRDFVSEVTNACLAMLAGDMLSRSVLRRPLLLIPFWLYALLATAALAATVTLSTSLGTVSIMTALLVAMCGVIAQKKSGRWPVFIAVGLALAVGIGEIANDDRTYRVIETIPLTQDVDRYSTVWLDPLNQQFPKTASGNEAEVSTFLRLTWAKVALCEIVDYPLGLGYGHRAFGYAVNKRFGTNFDLQSSHCGWLDFALGGGLPALALWLLLSCFLLRYAWQASFVSPNPAGFALLIYTTNYLIRSAIDNHMSGLRLEQYLMLVVLLAVSATIPHDKACA